MDFLKTLSNCLVKKIQPFGSRVVGCATESSDYDYLVLVPYRPGLAQMANSGFTPDALDPLYGPDFSSWKNKNVNLVFTDSEQYFDDTMEACAFCTKYKVYDKEDRCKIHELFRNRPTAETIGFMI